MYRERRKKLRRRRRRTVAFVAAAVTVVAVGIPTLAAADPVGDLLHNLGLGGTQGSGGATGGGGTATPDAGNPPSYTPPLHGTEPHGQGSDAVVDLTPATTSPLPGDPTQGNEEVVAGDSRGQQSTDGYHGRVT